MRYLKFILVTLACFSSLLAYDFDEAFSDDDDMLTLDSEIEAILEEEETRTGEDAQAALEDYDDFLFDDEYTQPQAEKQAPLPITSAPKKVEINEEKNPSIAVELDKVAAEEETLASSGAPLMESIVEQAAKSAKKIEINLRQVFSGSPIIYTLLFILSTISVCVWLYSMLTIRSVDFLPPKLVKELRTKLISNQYDEALDMCVKQKHFFCKMLASGI